LRSLIFCLAIWSSRSAMIRNLHLAITVDRSS
jgi:hypothetical protein